MKKDLENALFIISKKLSGRRIKWRIGGGTNLLLWGIDIDTKDIDLITTKSGAYDIEKLLKKYLVKPVEFSESDKFASYFGKLKINGVNIDIMGDLKVKVKDIWIKSSIKSVKVKRFINGEELIFPLNDLKEHLRAYKIINREKDLKKIKLIQSFLKDKKGEKNES